ncbi:hypothetical protein KOR34_04810 [Posidoniimonas corsicana]|uniref:Uncharacterized protein n=1 Tax=Posidoniimonas corsicana TaxID=1938618 RepID=A0A5C5VAK9_9BACT|nr:hypothetical protein [Posidoniimonas corsicana]TWT35588.1 hypothetical protein KOR34_04810 [Posidoniimonas corsicana]
MRRSRHENAFSLFAFQDIITAVTGVVVLLTLMLAVELVQRKEISLDPGSPSSAARAAELSALVDEAETLEKTLREIQALVEEAAAVPFNAISQRKRELEKSVLSMEEESRNLSGEINRVELSRQQAAAKSEALSETVDLDTLRQQLGALKSRLNSLLVSPRVAYNPSPLARKSALLVDLSPEFIRVSRPGLREPLVQFDKTQTPARIDDLSTWAISRDPGDEYFVILVRPKCLAMFDETQRRLRELGFDLGIDLLGPTAVLSDASQSGDSR